MICQSFISSAAWRKAIVLTTVAFATTCSTFTAQAQKANFSGDWSLNEGKSDLGQFSRMAPRKMKVAAQADTLSVQRFSTTPDGTETTYTDKFSFDGKETETTVFGTMIKKSTARWADDGQTLNVNSTIAFDRNGQTFEVKITEVWKLTEGGKVLNVTSTSNSQMGTNTTNLFFEKAG